MKDCYMMSNNVKSKVDLRNVDKTPITTQNTIDLIPTIPISSTPVPRSNGRVVAQPDRFMYLGESFGAIPMEHEIDPTDYAKVISDVDAHLWQKAMEAELESMYFNKVWEFVEAPERIKPIGCKWVYKKKKGVYGKVETFKVRLVAKGYSQKPDFDYEETFSLVAMLKSIGILLSIATRLYYEIWRMDVKTTFFNGNIDESVFMMQPDGFVAKGQEHMVCKFHKSIYGLKKAFLLWHNLKLFIASRALSS